MPAVKHAGFDTGGHMCQPIEVGGHLFFGVPGIGTSAADQHGRKTPGRRDVGRHVCCQNDHAARGRGRSLRRRSVCRRSISHSAALRKARKCDRRRHHLELTLDGLDDGGDVGEVVRDSQLAVLSRHPARDDAFALGVERVKRLNRDEQPAAHVRNAVQRRHVRRRVFAVAVEAEKSRPGPAAPAALARDTCRVRLPLSCAAVIPVATLIPFVIVSHYECYDMTLRIGIDLGGTKIEGIALAGSREVARLRVPTPRDDYDATLDAIVSLTIELENRAGGSGTVGIGIPGAISPSTGLVKNANSVWLIGRPLRDDLSARLAREVRIANDANCFAVSEAADGAAAGAAVVFGVILGTGTGAGIVVRGAPLVGANAIAGEWGHMSLPWADAGDEPQPECYCGKRGCVETYLSGPALAADHERRTGVRHSVPEILERAAARRSRRRRHAGALRHACGARSGRHHQRARPRRHRRRGRPVEYRPSVRSDPAAVGSLGVCGWRGRRGAYAPRSRPAWRFERRARRRMVVA